MKRKLLFVFIIASTLLSGISKAQLNSWLGPRLLVNSPASVMGFQDFTYSYSQTWGRNLDSVWINVPLVKAVTDTTACTAISAITGNKWALIYRGNCEFSAKAYAAQQAGAKGVIIVNNQPGFKLVNMSGGTSAGSVTIPVLFITKEEGDLICAQLNASQVVTISVSPWGFNNAHDIAVVRNSATRPAYGAIPATQTASGSPAAYRFYTGGFVANTGTSTETNVKLKSTLQFTPTGGSPSVVFSDSVTVPSLTVNDSIIEDFSNNVHNANGSTTGQYDYSFNVSCTNTDMQPLDNNYLYSTYVTERTFSKARYDNVNKKPFVNTGYRLASGGTMTWGPLFYVNKGGFNAESIQYSLFAVDTNLANFAGQQQVVCWIFKWSDGVGGLADSIIEIGELTAVGTAARPFTASDSDGTIIQAQVTDANGDPNPVPLTDNTMYWVAPSVDGATFYLGVDNDINYYTRTVAGGQFATAKFWDYYAPLFSGKREELTTIADTLIMFPFTSKAVSKDPDNVSFTGQKGLVPSITLTMGQFPTSVNSVALKNSEFSVYPNPAVDNINAAVNLDKVASKVDFLICNGFGSTVYTETKTNVQKGVFSFSTASLAPGTYYMLINADGKMEYRQFTKLSK